MWSKLPHLQHAVHRIEKTLGMYEHFICSYNFQLISAVFVKIQPLNPPLDGWKNLLKSKGFLNLMYMARLRH